MAFVCICHCRFIEDLNSINDGGEFKTNCCDVHPGEYERGKENSDKNEASFLDLNSKIRDGKF